MSSRAHQVPEDALVLSEDERVDLAEQLAELERRARRAIADPAGGEAWDAVERRIDARFAGR